MAVEQTRMSGWVKLKSDADYATLKTTGTFTQDGVTINYSDKTVYVTPSNGIGGTTLQGNTAVVTNAAGEVINSGVTSTELSYVANARSNIQKQIDDLKAQIGTGTGNYFADDFSQIDYSKPGNWYIDNGDGTYFYGIVDDNGSFKPVQSRVDPSEIGQQDLTAYQKKTDTTITVKSSAGVPQSTVVGALNALGNWIGTASLPSGHTVTSAINALFAGGGGTGTIALSGTNGIAVTNPSAGTYVVGHAITGATSARTYGSIISTGRAQLPLVTTDAFGHTTSGTVLQDFFIPSTPATTSGDVWTWDAANGRGAWMTPTGGGGSTYTATNGIKIDGSIIQHTNSGKAASVGSVGDALRVITDDQGHVTTLDRQSGTAGQYIGSDWSWVTPKKTADEILSGSGPYGLTTAASILDIMGGLRMKKMTQAQYDALGTKDPNTVYIIVG